MNYDVEHSGDTLMISAHLKSSFFVRTAQTIFTLVRRGIVWGTFENLSDLLWS